MIYDSQEEKNYVLECVRKYPTNYETALNLANAFGQSLQDGRVIAVAEQVAKFPLGPAPTTPTVPVSPKAMPDGKRIDPPGGERANGEPGPATIQENVAPDNTAKGPE
jgi:hypothetical protein